MMKQSLGIVLIFGLHLQLQAQTSMAQVNNTTYLKPPEVPMYETCSYVSTNNRDVTYRVQDPACVARNQELQRTYNAQVQAYNYSKQMVSANGSTVTKPQEPQYQNCQSGTADEYGNYSVDYQCQLKNQQMQQAYNQQMMGWNKMQQVLAADPNANQNSAVTANAVAAVQANSATEALQKAQQQNLISAQRSSSAGSTYMQMAVKAAAAYAVSCMGFGACNPEFLALSIAFGVISTRSNRQAAENYASAADACRTQAQISSTTAADCSALSSSGMNSSNSSFTNPYAEASKAFDTSGNCIASDKTLCHDIISSLPPGTNIKDAVGKMSAFATNPPVKFNPDGSVTTKDGKTLTAEDLNNKEAMLAAGLTPSQIAAISDGLGKAGGAGLGNLPGGNGTDGSSGAGLKNTDKNGKPIDFGGFAISGSGSDSSANGAGANASGSLSAKGISGSSSHGKDGFGKNRSPAGAGLTRDFNGETIGAAGDDIFIMMNRRYKTKTAQDTFLNN